MFSIKRVPYLTEFFLEVSGRCLNIIPRLMACVNIVFYVTGTAIVPQCASIGEGGVGKG